MDGSVHGSVDGTSLVNGLSNNVDDSAKSTGAHGHHDGTIGISDFLASNQTLSGVQGDRPYVVSTQMLRHFQHESVLGSFDLQGIENGREVSFELHVNDCTNNLRNLSSMSTCTE